MKSIAERSLDMAGLFEAEVFVRLMLKVWKHPFAENNDFAEGMLEAAAEALAASTRGQQLIEEIPPADFNFVAAVWYAEQCALQSDYADPKASKARIKWLSTVRRTLPSCFCNPSDLNPE